MMECLSPPLAFLLFSIENVFSSSLLIMDFPDVTQKIVSRYFGCSKLEYILWLHMLNSRSFSHSHAESKANSLPTQSGEGGRTERIKNKNKSLD